MSAHRRKPRLFSFSREVEMALFEETVTDPADRRALGELIDAFLEICREQAVSPATLETVARAARHASPYVRGVGITRLAVLTHYFEAAVGVMDQVTRDESEEVRLYACSALANTPEHVAFPLVAHAIDDTSWRVRKAAAQAAGAIASPDLIPVLTRRLQREQDARVRVALQIAIDFQRHAVRATPPPAPSATYDPAPSASAGAASPAAELAAQHVRAQDPTEQTEQVGLPGDGGAPSPAGFPTPCCRRTTSRVRKAAARTLSARRSRAP
jgi:hypothetical protein